jgi:hypothetical protein
MEAKFDEALLFVLVQCSEDFSSIQEMGVCVDATDIIRHQRRIEEERQPVAVD